MRLSFFCGFFAFVLTVQADEAVYHDSKAYDQSRFGAYPIQRFKSTHVVSPRPNILKSSPDCSDLYTFLTPRGDKVLPNALILDQNGHMIWTVDGYKQIYNLMVQEYNGENYLTFWAGNDAVGGHGAGYYYMLDTSYTQMFKISAANKIDADLHDFRITKEGTAYFTLYQVLHANLSSVGKHFPGSIWDCLIQEIDLATGKLLFQWRASEHYTIDDSYKPIGIDGTKANPFDFFHINSIDKDYRGNYLISSRYTHSLTYIDGKTGDVIWILGGKRNMFKDVSSGNATNFKYQHDARWSDNHTTITIFDNAVDDINPDVADTRGIRLSIDEEAMIVKLVRTYMHPHRIHAVSQGSFQDLENGNVLMGYGNGAAFTEFSNDGTMLCDTHFGPESRYGTSEVQSYRAYKYEWHATPRTDPDSAIVQTRDKAEWCFYVSWNGATEVKDWVLQGSNNPDASYLEWTELERRPKDEFEEEFHLYPFYPAYLRAAALDKHGETLGISPQLDVKTKKVGEFSSSFPISSADLTEMNITSVFDYFQAVRKFEQAKADVDRPKAWALTPLKLEEGGAVWLKRVMVFCVFCGLGLGFREATLIWRARRRRRRVRGYKILPHSDSRLA